MSIREHALRITLLMAFVLTVQCWMLARNTMPAQDGISFIRIVGYFNFLVKNNRNTILFGEFSQKIPLN